MTQKKNTAEGQTDGVTPTPANSDDFGDDAFYAVVISGTGSLQYKAAAATHGSMGFRASASTTNDPAYVVHTTAAGVTSLSARITSRGIAAYPPGVQILMAIRATDGTAMGHLALNSTGHFVVLDKAGSTKHTSTYVLPLNTAWRGEMKVIAGSTTSNGTIQTDVFEGESTTSQDSYAPGATVNTGTVNPQFCRFGIYNLATPGGAWTFDFDDPTLDDTNYPIGPAASYSTPVITDANPKDDIIDARGSSAGGGGTMAYSVAKLSGTDLTYEEVAEGYFVFVKSTAGSAVYRVTGTAATSGMSGVLDVTIPQAGTTAAPTLRIRVFDGTTLS